MALRDIMRIGAVSLIALLAGLPAVADELDARAVAMFEGLFGEDQCPHYARERPAPVRRAFQVAEHAREVTVTTFEFDCALGAYNEVQAVLMHTELNGLSPAAFAVPVLDVVYRPTAENRDDPSAGPVERIGILGYGTATTLINPSFDARTGQIVTAERWRGLGDASASGVWDLTPAGYVLRRYEVDATYDGEVDPVTVLDLREEEG